MRISRILFAVETYFSHKTPYSLFPLCWCSDLVLIKRLFYACTDCETRIKRRIRILEYDLYLPRHILAVAVFFTEN